MAIRTVRLDEDDEAALAQIRSATGLAISDALKEGLRTLQARLHGDTRQRPHDIFQQLDLGPGGYAIAPSTETRRGVRDAIRRKLGR